MLGIRPAENALQLVMLLFFSFDVILWLEWRAQWQYERAHAEYRLHLIIWRTKRLDEPAAIDVPAYLYYGQQDGREQQQHSPTNRIGSGEEALSKQLIDILRQRFWPAASLIPVMFFHFFLPRTVSTLLREMKTRRFDLFSLSTSTTACSSQTLQLRQHPTVQTMNYVYLDNTIFLLQIVRYEKTEC